MPHYFKTGFMQHIEYSNSSPARLLACDHALLEGREAQGGESVLVFWESASLFVVLGYTESAAREANREECAHLHIPILRRISGGGTVVQGVGCLNYSLVLPINAATENLEKTNRFVMERQREGLQSLTNSPISIRGTTDLALCENGVERKFSGNAQRRKKNWLLFHGTILLSFHLPFIERVLNFPSRQPEYREHRDHLDFVCNFPSPRNDVKNALRQVWNAHRVLDVVPHERIEALARDVYEQENWNFRL